MPFSGQTMNILIRETPFQPKLGSVAEQISYPLQMSRVRAISAGGEGERRRERVRVRGETVSGGLILCGTRCRRIYTDTCTVNVITA